MGMGSGFKGRTNVSYWWHTWTIICMLHTRPCVLNDIANIKSRHVQSWGRAGLVGWAGYTSPVQGQVGKCQHYPAQSRAGPAMPQLSPPAKLSAQQRAADVWRVHSRELIKSCFTQQLTRMCIYLDFFIFHCKCVLCQLLRMKYGTNWLLKSTEPPE